MAINRALMNRQMYNMGGSSLETGAPDITLTGDMRPTYSAMRKQRLAGGGIASMRDRIKYDVKPGETLVGKPGGLVEPGVKQYGLLSKIKDKIVDDLIPNEIKENPMITALGGAALINQFGLPDKVTEYLNMGSNVGQNFIGDLINRDLVLGPGGEQFNFPFESTIGTLGDIASTVKGGLTDFLDPNYYLGKLGIDSSLMPNMSTNQANQLAVEQYKRRNLQADLAKALAAGSAAGAYVESQPKDELPTDTTGVNFQTAQQAMDDPNLRFKPPLEATQLAADGGRIGYQNAGPVKKDPYDVIEGMDNELNPSTLDSFLGTLTGKYGGVGEGASLIKEIQDYKYGKSFPGEEVGTVNEFNQFDVIPKPDRPPMSMEETIKALEDEWERQLEEGMEPGSGNDGFRYFDNMGIYKKEDIRRRVELGYDQAKGPVTDTGIMKAAQGGRIGAQEGGLMDLGGMEKDYREEGGFVPIGGKEKADDVPARLSKNEFVFTADAVRNAGGGDIDEGAAVMERLMDNLEQGGKVSEESQGLAGAREMFETSQRLEKRII